MRSEIVSKTVRIVKALREPGDFISGFVKQDGHSLLSQKLCGGQTCKTGSENDDGFLCF